MRRAFGAKVRGNGGERKEGGVHERKGGRREDK